MGCVYCKGNDDKYWLETNLSKDDRDYLMFKLRDSSCFREFDEDSLNDVVLSMTQRQYNKYDVIFRRGDHTDSLYFILNGQCEAIQNNQHMVFISKGSIIGELNMIHKINRSHDLVCVTSTCTILKLRNVDFTRVYNDYLHKKSSIIYQTLSRTELFQGLSKSSIRKIENLCTVRSFHEGDLIVNKDEVGPNVFIIQCGSVTEDVYDDFSSIGELSPKSPQLSKYRCFGEETMLGDPYSSTVIANKYTKAIILDSNVLKSSLFENEKIKTLNRAVDKKHTVLKLKKLSKLKPNTSSKAQLLKNVSYDDYNSIFNAWIY